MPCLTAMAFIAGISWALRLDTTMLIRIGSPASCAAASPRMNRRNDPLRRVIPSYDSSVAPYRLSASWYGRRVVSRSSVLGWSSRDPLEEIMIIMPMSQAAAWVSANSGSISGSPPVS